MKNSQILLQAMKVKISMQPEDKQRTLSETLNKADYYATGLKPFQTQCREAFAECEPSLANDYDLYKRACLKEYCEAQVKGVQYLFAGDTI